MTKVYLGNNTFDITFTSGNTVQLTTDEIKELIENGVDVLVSSSSTPLSVFNTVDNGVEEHH